MGTVARTDLATLRANIKAEMTRRAGFHAPAATDNPATYNNDSTYGVSTPNAGDQIMVAHGKGIVNPLVAINDFGDLRNVVQNEVIPNNFDTASINSYISTLSGQAMGAAATSCRSACTGLCISYCTTGCQGSCLNGCNGCTGECSGGCAASCTGTSLV